MEKQLNKSDISEGLDSKSIHLLLNVLQEATEESNIASKAHNESKNSSKEEKPTTQDVPTENKLINEETVGTVKQNLKSLNMLPYIDRARREHFRPVAKYAQHISPIFFHIREDYINSLIHTLKNYVFKEAIVKLFCRDISIIEINQYDLLKNIKSDNTKSNKSCQSTFSITLLKDNINIEYLNIKDTFTKDNCIFNLNNSNERLLFLNLVKNLDSSGLMKDTNHSQLERVISLKF